MNIQNLFESTFGNDIESTESESSRENTSINIYEKEKISTDNLHEKMKEEFGLDGYKARILVIGVGGMGSNVITKITEMDIKGAETVAINTDAGHLVMTKANKKILIGKESTKGLGAGGDPEIGKKAAEESRNELKDLLSEVDLVFLVCGLGGGTGTGAAPVISRIAKEQGALVISAGTLPFQIEGARMAKAEDGLYQLRQTCDTVIIIENQKLLEYGGNLPLRDAFKLGDEVISHMIKGITETISQPSLVNLDYADVRTIMKAGGVSTIGIGISNSSDRAKEAIEKALKHPLLQIDYSGATGALIQIIGGPDLRLEEVNEVGQFVSKHLSPEAQTIWGARILDEYDGKIQVITIVTGVKSPYILGPMEKQKEGSVHVETSQSLGIDVLR
ncbi:MAG: cell division protein FtsZ [Candidatus Aenigmarchaeota archaeon ex4484_56]|nr:MAG: cell division protein FtsZ [Candidatus Aenigmarchaeota archaeon ex4484_56]